MADAIQVTERLRQAVEDMHIPVGEDGFCEDKIIRVTVSLGIVELTPDTTNLMDLITRVDQALYAAKQVGRNCVKIGI